MGKNIAAFLDDTAYSLSVRFGNTGYVYTYVTNIPGIEVGDAIVVPVTNAIRKERAKFDSINEDNEGRDKFDAKVTTVVEVHSEVNIPTDSDLEYRWVICKLDFGYYTQLMERNNKITAAVDDACNLRRSFADRILGDMLDGPKQELLGLLGNQKREPLTYSQWLTNNDYPDSSKSLQAYQDYVSGFNNA